jgi:NADPH:quinone reductase-like Zn-dependent oxidoreductase
MMTNPTAKTTTATMRAIVQDRYGSAEVLRAARVARPVIADNQVLLHVNAAGLDRGTEHLMTGKPYVARLFVGLVVGASGGVGTYAVQLAKAFGAEVTGVSSAAKIDLVRSLGADHVIDYTREDFADGIRRYDLILDIGGSTPVRRLRRALRPTPATGRLPDYACHHNSMSSASTEV